MEDVKVGSETELTVGPSMELEHCHVPSEY